MYNKILVPLDGSELSECSIQHAKSIALGDKVPEVILFRVIEHLEPNDAAAWVQAGYTVTDVLNKNIDHAKRGLAALVDMLTQQGVPARSVVVQGRAAETILDYAEKNNVDLIIMSSHGRTGISKWAFGSVADRVVRHSTIPVLVVTAPNCRVSPASSAAVPEGAKN